MKSFALVLIALVLCGTASPAASQWVTQPQAFSSLVTASPVAEAPRTGASFAADGAVRVEPQSLHVAAADDARWNAAFLGAAAGAVVGGLVGVWAEKESQDGIAPPAYYISVPLGAVVGFIVGLQVQGR